MPLTDDEYSCLMIMAEGQNLIAMRNTRWFDSIMSLAGKGFAKPTGDQNYVITTAGRSALEEHEGSLDGVLRNMITTHGQINDARLQISEKLKAAKFLLVEAAQIGSRTTGESVASAFKKCVDEISQRAQELLK